VGPGLVGIELFAPAPKPARVEIRLGEARSSAEVGPDLLVLAVPVLPALVRAGRATLELTSTTFSPGGGDARELGVAVSRIWYLPESGAVVR